MKPTIVFAALMAVVFSLRAQPEQAIKDTAKSVINHRIGGLVARFDACPSASIQQNIIDLFPQLLADLVVKLHHDRTATRQLADEWRFRRVDVQTGAATSSGTTNAVLNPLLPAVFGISMESGAITRTINGNTVSIKINPAGLFCSSAVPGSEAALRVNGCLDMWRRVGASFSLDTNRGNVPNSATGIKPLGDQFSEAAVRVSLIDRRHPKNPAFQKRLGTWEKSAKIYANRLNKMAFRWQNFRDSAEKLLKSAKDKDKGERENAVRKKMADLLFEAYRTVEENDVTELTRLVDDWAAAEADNQDLYYQYAHGLVISAEYALQRPDVATEQIDMVVPASIRPPNLHTGRLLIAKGLPNRSLDFNFNLSTSWFSETRPGMMGRLRDIRTGVESKFLLRKIPSFGVPVLSFAGVWMHLRQPPLGLGITFQNETISKINKPGNIGVFQAKLELPTANATVRIPLSLTYANRTELVRESDVGAQIGITVNLDALFANPGR